jgi:hypothetical protein
VDFINSGSHFPEHFLIIGTILMAGNPIETFPRTTLHQVNRSASRRTNHAHGAVRYALIAPCGCPQPRPELYQPWETRAELQARRILGRSYGATGSPRDSRKRALLNEPG